MKNIKLRVRRGDFYAVVGQVGSGKSTLISTILGGAVARFTLLEAKCSSATASVPTLPTQPCT
jgi:ABC-type lipoprotein export system ATPase subunit